jgi:hypothetical protein
MRIGPIAHGVLLIAALVFGYQTWTREKPSEPKTGTVVVWTEPESSFESLQYDEETKSVRLEVRGEGSDRYLWGLVKTSRKAPPKPKEGEQTPPEPAPAPEPPTEDNPLDPENPPAPEEMVTTTREFPVGEDGDPFRKNVSALRALRDLGVLDDKKKEEYGLTEGTDNLSVTFKGGKPKSLIIGKRVFGGADRYVIDPASGRGFVLSSEIMNKISGAEHSLGLKKLHAYEDGKLARVVIKTPGGERTLLRSEVDDPEKGKQTVWADAAAPLKQDLTLANFMDRVDKMRPTQYLPEVDAKSAKLIASVVYKDASGKQLGYLELYRQEPGDQPGQTPPDGTDPANAAKKPQVKYYVKSALTRVLGEVARMTAERAHQDFAEMFGAEPVPASPEPEMPPTAPPGAGDPHGMPGDPHGMPGDPHGHGAPPPGGAPKPAGGQPPGVPGSLSPVPGKPSAPAPAKPGAPAPAKPGAPAPGKSAAPAKPAAPAPAKSAAPTPTRPADAAKPSRPKVEPAKPQPNPEKPKASAP